jgi:cytochrome P450
LTRIRVEHDVVFNSDLFKISNLLIEQAHLINQLSYIVVVIKETLRLFSAVSIMRGDLSEIELQNFNESRYSTAEINIWILHSVLQQHFEYWKKSDSFISDRWLVDSEDFLYLIKNAWRLFQFDLRNCVEQTLVILNVKTMLIMTIREFDIHFVYEEWDQVHSKKKIKTVNEERAYQISSEEAHSTNEFSCKISLKELSSINVYF